jgi:membrane protease YdiL (CAAX protease family)
VTRSLARITAIAAVVLALSFAVAAASNALDPLLPLAVQRLGSTAYYGLWVGVALLHRALWPARSVVPWRVQLSSPRDRMIAGIAAALALAMYAPLFVAILRDGYTPPRLDFAGGVVAAPIVEESLFRGLVWNHIARAAPTERAGVILNLVAGSLIFGLFHLSFEGLSWLALANVVPHALFGALIGVLRWRTRSLLPGTIVHLVGNFVARLALP